MKLNTMYKTAFALAAGALLMGANSSEAAIIQLDPLEGIPKNGTGIPGPGENGNDPDNNYYRLITYFNVDDYCEPTDVDSWKPTNQTNVWTSGLSDYDYAVVHYGGGAGGGGIYAWYLNGEDSATFPSSGPGQFGTGGFSSIDFFKCTGDDDTPGVPEGGTSVALLGLTLAGLGAARRFTKKA
jgi:hypothetical protein